MRPTPYAQPPGHALHLIERGCGRRACFLGEDDCAAFLRALADCAARTENSVHAYALMGNHVHLLVTPARAGGATLMMQLLCERYARYFAATHRARDPVFDERGRALPLHSRRHLLSCMRYIEMNPVHARLARAPGDYRWSSYGANALGRRDALVAPHAAYCALGRTSTERQAAYRALFGAAPP